MMSTDQKGLACATLLIWGLLVYLTRKVRRRG